MIEQPLNIPISDDQYKLTDDYTYRYKKDGAIYSITVPKGYVTDGASVPRLFWSLTGIHPDGLIRAPALIHDFIYDHRGRLPWGSQHDVELQQVIRHVWTRKEADKLFAVMMRDAGMSKIRRRLAYLAVRGFAMTWRFWND